MAYIDELRAIKLGTLVRQKKIPTPIAKKSDKRKTDQKEYIKIVKEMLKENPMCDIKSIHCTGKAEGLHHITKRSPNNLLEKSNLKRSCNACNLFIENNQEWAEKNGHFKSKFKK